MKHTTNVRLKRDPFPLIFAQGDRVTRLACLDFFGLGDSPLAKECLLGLIKRQRFDGSFPSCLDPQSWGMQETVRNALLLLKVGLPPEGVNVSSAGAFILDHQRPDGGWCENRALDIPPERTWLSNERSVTWLTADVVELLRRVGMGERSEYRAAVEWLRTMQSQRGGWPSLAQRAGGQPRAADDPDATAQIAFLMKHLYGEHDPAYLKGRALFESYLDESARDAQRGYWIRLRDGRREQLDVYYLTHLLLSWHLDPPRRLHSGYDASDPRVKRMMDTLIDIQREDGGWRPFWADESCPIYTFLAVKVLVLSAMLAREDLHHDVEAHAV
jgi:hypothetical protein